jgi:hypothetical protein
VSLLVAGDWIGEQAEREGTDCRPEGPATVIETRDVVYVMNQADREGRAIRKTLRLLNPPKRPSANMIVPP